jgi:hypothetical protein
VALGTKHPPHFAYCAIPVRHVAQTERDRDTIERFALERKLQGISENGFRHSFPARYFEHFRRKIGSRNVRFRQLTLNGKGQIATAGCEIEDIARVPGRDNFRGAASPKKIGATAKEVIREIVTPRDPAKHRAHRIRIARDTCRVRKFSSWIQLNKERRLQTAVRLLVGGL